METDFVSPPYFYVMSLNIIFHGNSINGTWSGPFDWEGEMTAFEAYDTIRKEVYAMLADDINEKLKPYPRLKASDIGPMCPVVTYYHLERNTSLQMS